MLAPPRAGRPASPLKALLENAPSVLLAPVPLALLQPIFNRIATHVATSRPELFNRLGAHAGKRFLIDPTDLPFVLVLTPLPERPLLTAHRRYERVTHDAAIAGTFFNLLDMIDGSLDGDALFFSRDLQGERGYRGGGGVAQRARRFRGLGARQRGRELRAPVGTGGTGLVGGALGAGEIA